jgi:hypothetical protein
MLKTAVAHLCMTWVLSTKLHAAISKNSVILMKILLVCIMLISFEVTADDTHCYDFMKRFSNITLSVTQ